MESSNYPQKYSPNEDKEWIFNQTTGMWVMTIQQLQLQESTQCQSDYLIIRLSKSSQSTPIKLCGSADTGRTFVSEGPFLRLEFHSDSKYEEKGFSIEVQHVMNEADAKIVLSRKKGTEIKLVTHVENEGLFIVLLGVLALAALVFFAMLGCFIVGVMKRRHERVIQRDMITRLQTQTGNTAVMGRRYSRKGSMKEHNRPDFLRSFSNQSTTGLLSYQSAGYPQTAEHV